MLPIVSAFDASVISQTVALTTAQKFADEEQLEALRRLDQFRHWHSLDEKRCCLVCGKIVTGRQIQVTGGTRDHTPLRLSCPTEQCNSIPMDWVLPTDEMLARLKTVAVEESKIPVSSTAAAKGGNTVHAEKGYEHLLSRLRRVVFHLIPHS